MGQECVRDGVGWNGLNAGCTRPFAPPHVHIQPGWVREVALPAAVSPDEFVTCVQLALATGPGRSPALPLWEASRPRRPGVNADGPHWRGAGRLVVTDMPRHVGNGVEQTPLVYSTQGRVARGSLTLRALGIAAGVGLPHRTLSSKSSL